MKLTFKILFLLLINSLHAQKTITEGVFKDKNGEMPLYCLLNPISNELVFLKGSSFAMTFAKKITNAKIYNTKGEAKTIETYDGLISVTPSQIDDSYIIGTFKSAMSLDSKELFLINGKTKTLIDNDKLDYNMYFDKNEVCYAADDKDKTSFMFNQYLKLEKRDYFINKYNFATKKLTKLQIQEPSNLNVNKKELYDFDADNFKFSLLNNNTVEVVQKTIGKLCNSSTLFRFLYDSNGKIIKEVKYEINLTNPFRLSKNQGGFSRDLHDINTNANFTLYKDVNFAYDYRVDDKGNLYVFGILGTLGRKHLESDPTGYFVIKYDTEGNKIWERIANMDDPNYKKENKKFSNLVTSQIGINFGIYNDESIYFSMESETKDLLYYDIVNYKNGKSQKTNFTTINLDRISAMTSTNYFVYAM